MTPTTTFLVEIPEQLSEYGLRELQRSHPCWDGDAMLTAGVALFVAMHSEHPSTRAMALEAYKEAIGCDQIYRLMQFIELKRFIQERKAA